MFMKIVRLVFSKYLLATVAFVAWIGFFDENNLVSLQNKELEIKTNEANIAFLKNDNKEMRSEIKSMYTDPATLERYAREHFRMKRDNEDLFVVEK